VSLVWVPALDRSDLLADTAAFCARYGVAMAEWPILLDRAVAAGASLVVGGRSELRVSGA
jgi:hypothetical protein